MVWKLWDMLNMGLIPGSVRDSRFCVNKWFVFESQSYLVFSVLVLHYQLNIVFLRIMTFSHRFRGWKLTFRNNLNMLVSAVGWGATVSHTEKRYVEPLAPRACVLSQQAWWNSACLLLPHQPPNLHSPLCNKHVGVSLKAGMGHLLAFSVQLSTGSKVDYPAWMVRGRTRRGRERRGGEKEGEERGHRPAG